MCVWFVSISLHYFLFILLSLSLSLYFPLNLLVQNGLCHYSIKMSIGSKLNEWQILWFWFDLSNAHLCKMLSFHRSIEQSSQINYIDYILLRLAVLNWVNRWNPIYADTCHSSVLWWIFFKLNIIIVCDWNNQILQFLYMILIKQSRELFYCFIFDMLSYTQN